MKKITFLFALLCASVMGWAVDQDTWIGSTDPTYNNQFKWYSISAVTPPSGVVNIQTNGFTAEIGIYVTFPDAAFNAVYYNGVLKTIGEHYSQQGAGLVFHISSLTEQNTEIILKMDETVKYGLKVYNDKGAGESKTDPELSINSTAETLDANVPETFQIIPTQSGDGAISYETSNSNIASVNETGLVTAVGRGTATITVRSAETATYAAASKKLTVTVTGPINWDAVSWLANSDNKYKMVVDPTSGINIVNVQNRTAGKGIYVEFPSAVWGDCSLTSDKYETQGAGRWFFLSAFPLQYNEFTQVCQGTTYTFNVYYEDGTPVGGLVETITLDQHTAAIEKDQEITLTAEVLPAAASDKSLIWTSNHEEIATVVDGVVTGVAPGTAVITATAHDGSGIYDQCTVTVEAISEKTWWGLETINEIPVMYSITRNTDKTLTYTVYFGGDASTWVKQINVNGLYFNLTGYDNVDRVASYTTETTHNAGTKITPDHFFFFGGPRIELADAYIVGASNTKPSTAVASVEISLSETTLAPGEGVQLTASVLPSFVENKAISWSSDDASIASVSTDGYVTANVAGDAVITATSVADGTKSASCTIHVVAALTPATWYGAGMFDVNGNLVAANYSITRNANRTLTYHINVSEDVAGLFMRMNNGDWHDMGYARETEWTSTEIFNDGVAHNFYFYMAYTSNASQINVTYTVGSSNTQPNTLLALSDGTSNTAKIANYNNVLVDAELNRTFPNTDEWYTLCLPFDLSDAQLTEVFGAGYTIAEMVGAEDHGSLVHLNFDYAPAFTAGKAYLLRPGTGVTAYPTFEDVTIQDVDPETLKSHNDYMDFQGTFAQITLNQENQRFVGPENYLYAPDTESGTNMKAFRCYFTIPGGSSAGAPGKRAMIVIGRQSPTGVDQISEQAVPAKFMMNGTLYIIRDGNTYNAQGMLVK